MNEFELLVFDMREAQKNYYLLRRDDPRKQDALKLSKALEKKVDDKLYSIHNPGLF